MIMVKFLGDGKGADIKIEGEADVLLTEISCVVLGLIAAAREEAAKDGISPEMMLEDTISSIYKISKKNLDKEAVRFPDGGIKQ